MHKDGDSSKNKDIYNKNLINERVNKVNENKIENIKGVESLNCVKRKGKLDYYMIGTFWFNIIDMLSARSKYYKQIKYILQL
ncbi:MAG: hypothetical protein N4A57_02115 [Anaeromicrobium sp.]|uniref:hypothetical protein n=1 Tax=Anaeromicrobium sp. TaxID=1929132 RepID=UPI0025F80A46|nr:hypothetical protein [Anaeromicrobium sp.]MCT4593062.1 hypothetical protein [Anaeromicrobium sp.]